MNIETTKIELAKLILQIDSELLLEKVKDFLVKETEDFWDTFTDQQKEEIFLGLSQLDKKERIAFDDFLKNVQ